ncbi:sensor c-di-GMP phosphodiesterase-like protein [Pararhizobium capsulatum DSM 1112]|uniref:cyclic-guanylate-specific phosphodiesterase n=1 Tax=Pararhizobium capsulatum DSM 1112 TaxID=1121113 RepID=A0ABU0C1E5_9HYPH|nr:EAL domain-containing protein [Pararhizobium capsulatum]MDQ0323495.1 sensor c-di-GMP phosphodiesterase-like protein [Pararhizobium capsulatum DSM 1112]
MKRTIRLLDRYAILVCLLAGFVAGALGIVGARAIALSIARVNLDRYTTALLARADSISQETDNALAEANYVKGVACGPSDLRHLQKIAFNARYIKDVARVVDNKLACSSLLGVVSPPFARPPPDMVTPDGDELWVNTPLVLTNKPALIVKVRNANVVIPPSAFLDLIQQPFRYSVAIVNTAKGRVMLSRGERLVDDSVLIAHKDVSADTDADLIRVACSKNHSACAVAALDRGEAIAPHSVFIIGFGALGFLLGGFLSVIGYLLRRRPKPMNARLRHALQSNQLTMVFQPIVDLHTGRMISAEALIRWTDREGRTIPPDVFVSAAEKNGTAGEITAYVLRYVSRIAGPLLRDNPELVITVNIVAADLSDPKFYEILEQIFVASGIARHQIGLELTERSVAEQDVAIAAIARLRALGHPIYLDDFGTGYSSLAQLHDLNLDVIKLDRAFTNSVGTGSVSVSIVPQVLEMATALGLRVVVEGIETDTQYSYFASAPNHCYGQGWFISKPLSYDALVAFKAEH